MARGPMRRRPVRSEDPTLSPEANRLLTEELREVVGSDEVELPVMAVVVGGVVGFCVLVAILMTSV
ncbi:MAG TPA: hypothetical protein VGM91_15650 [Conexibacter sp.]